MLRRQLTSEHAFQPGAAEQFPLLLPQRNSATVPQCHVLPLHLGPTFRVGSMPAAAAHLQYFHTFFTKACDRILARP